MDAKTVGVVGCGLMGSGIAEIFARAGATVLVHEVDEEAAERGRARVERSLRRAASAGKLAEDDAAVALGRLSFGSDLEALAPADLVVEAANEDEHIKTDLFSRLDKIVQNRDAVLASNTSSVPIMKLGTVTSRPAQVVGMHFFNPVPVLPLVEVVPSLVTSPDTERRVVKIAEDLGKTVIRSQDRAGFIVNGCAHPMGPLHLADLIGADTVAAIATSMYSEFKEPLYAPPPLLLRMVDAGLLGRKSGRGFFDYT